MSSIPRTPSPTTTKHSAPIPIAGGGAHHRARSDSSATGYSSSSSDGSPVRTPPRPSLATGAVPRVAPPSAGTSPTSPFFSLLRAVPAKPAAPPVGYPFGREPLSALHDDESAQQESPVVRHARRASLAGTLPARFPSTTTVPTMPAAGAQTERGVGVLRRLSLGGAFGRPPIPIKPPTPPARMPSPPAMRVPTPPMPTPVSASAEPPAVRTPRTKRRSATLGASARPRREPSPMGERMLKGHFDSFH